LTVVSTSSIYAVPKACCTLSSSAWSIHSQAFCTCACCAARSPSLCFEFSPNHPLQQRRILLKSDNVLQAPLLETPQRLRTAEARIAAHDDADARPCP
jgi:hypothetical protein